MVSLSVVIPCLNEAPNISTIFGRLRSALNGIDYEIIFIDDGSTDSTAAKIQEISLQNQNVKLLQFSRNFGHQSAVTAGIEHAQGKFTALIDADLQDPPEILPQMLARAEQGFDVVYGRRRSRRGDGLFKRMTAHFFYRLLNLISRVEIPADTGDFRVMSRQVVEVLKLMPEKERFIRGMVSWTGFRQTAFDYDRESRAAGKSKYPLAKMLKFAIDGITSFSTAPLRFASAVGLVFAIISSLLICRQIYDKIMFGESLVKGWTSIIVVVLGTASIQFFLIGIQGEYLSRIFIETKNRPQYIVKKKINL